MKKTVFFKALSDFLSQCGISSADLIQMMKTESVSGVENGESQDLSCEENKGLSGVVFDNRGNFLFDVLYDGGVCSRQFLGDRKPLGVIWDGYVISLKNSPIPMTWDEAVKFCDNRKISGQGMEPGSIKFWKNFIAKRPFDLLNALFEYLGGEPLLMARWYWTASISECSDCYGMAFSLFTEEMYTRFSSHCHYSVDGFNHPNYVRPVLNVLKLQA